MEEGNQGPFVMLFRLEGASDEICISTFREHVGIR